MPPKRARKQASTSSVASSNNALVPSMVPTKRESLAITPSKSPLRRKMRITQSQKQALIDNLQLEITERARKMRAQYALQAQGLRTRLEIRVHRIPAALRKTNIAELLQKYSEQIHIHSAPNIESPAVSGRQEINGAAKSSVSTTGNARGLKRKSDECDAENKNSKNTITGEPKKKSRTANTQASENMIPRAAKMQPSQILSPKSNNSQILPQSPFKSGISPIKANPTRPVSPLKPSITAPTSTSLAKMSDKTSKGKSTGPRIASKQEKSATTAAPKQTRTKRAAAAAPPRIVDQDGELPTQRTSNVSDAASSSAGTTIVRTVKKSSGPVTATGIAKGKVAGVKAKFEGIGAAGKKVVAAPARAVAVPGAGGIVKGGRTLRKRG